jgi:DNA-binding NtrC family response regulator
MAMVRLLARLAPAPESRQEPLAPARNSAVHPAVGTFLFTESPAMRPVLEALTRAALFRYPVLLTGEPGVGKESCARALHAAWGPRKPFLPANCANLTPTLASSLLFGHRRGAFTGAERDQPGLVEAARGGILFLDEVGELPGETQAQLLRFLQDGSFLPVGEVHTRTSDARVVAATNRDLEEMVESKAFRADLFHRLNVIRVQIPPLRSRPEDIEPLFRRFLTEAARESSVEVPAVEGPLLERLRSHAWTGNVRELQNLAKALLVESHGERSVRVGHLPPVLRDLPARPAARESGPTLGERLAAAERRILEDSLREHAGHVTRAAKALGISRQALSQKMRRLGIARP